MQDIDKSQSHPNLTRQVIPARIVIGVTGHRRLDNIPMLINAIKTAIEKVRKMVPPLRITPLVFTILSPLAEGADRLVVREVLKYPESTLEVVLPMEKNNYLQDFETAESKAEFEELISLARSVRVLPSKNSRTEAYEQVGRYVVNQCEVLVALWNGNQASGRGGTQEIVDYARETKCPLVWINTEEQGKITLEPGRGLNTRAFHDLDEYNSERVNATEYEKQLKRQCDFFIEKAKSSKLPLDRLQATLEYTQCHYTRADILALRYQHLYYRTESLIYSLALTAVVIATFQILFIPQQPIILTSEIVLMLIILAIVGVSRRMRWHNKWLDYRFLAERFRSALFMALSKIDVSTLRPPRHLSLAYSPKDWMVPAFLSFWNKRPQLTNADFSMFIGLKDFICEAWIQDQINYHDNNRKRHYKRHYCMTFASYVLFGLTILAAILHVTNIGPRLIETSFAFAAIVFPAIAASITAIRTHRDYLRNSMRSAEMVRHLEELKEKLMAAKDYDDFLELLKEAEKTMLHENEDWRVVVRFHTEDVSV